LYAFFISPLRATCSANLIFLDFIAVIIKPKLLKHQDVQWYNFTRRFVWVSELVSDPKEVILI
jgi:hypothetical protein